MRVALGLAVIWLLLPASATAQPAAGQSATPPVDLGQLLAEQAARKPLVVASAFASTDQVVLGRRFSLVVVVEAARPDGPAPDVAVPTSLSLMPAFEVGRRFKESVIRVGGRIATEIQIELTAWYVGELQIPRIPVDVPLAGVVTRVYTEPVPIEVIGLVGADDGQVRDVAEPVSIMRVDWWPLIAGAAVVLALFFAGGIWWRRGRARVASAEPVPEDSEVVELSPAQQALAQLRALAATEVLTAADRRPGFQQMSDIVRRFLGRQFDVTTRDATTSELLAELRAGERMPPERISADVQPWLERCDLVKFADAHVSDAEVQRAYRLALALVEPSLPAPDVEQRGPQDRA